MIARGAIAARALAAGVVLGLAACAGPGGSSESRAPAVAIGGVTIRNELAYPVSEVLIEVPATGAFAGCGSVLPGSDCSNRFQQLDYRSQAVVVSWREHGRPHRTGEFVIEVPPGLEPGRPAQVEVIIFAPGEAGARLVQR